MGDMILVTGGTGFLGSALVDKCLQQGESVAVLTRNKSKVQAIWGDAVTAIADFSEISPDQCRAVVNLAGAGIFDFWWTATRKAELRASRIRSTERLIDWMASSQKRPAVLISGSAIGVYGDQGDVVIDESTTPTADFAQQLCVDWEASAAKAEGLGVRVCLIRTGLVIGPGGGLLEKMLLPFSLGLGGTLGDGLQWMSWIHLNDWLAIVGHLLDREDLQGAFNATAPNPVRNAEFSQRLASQLGRPMLLPLPAWLLRRLLGEMSLLLLGSQQVLPKRLLASGFVFEFSDLATALKSILSSDRAV